MCKVFDVFRKNEGYVIYIREGYCLDLFDLFFLKWMRQISVLNGYYDMGIGDKGFMGCFLVRGEYGYDIVDEFIFWFIEIVIDKFGKGSFWGIGIY